MVTLSLVALLAGACAVEPSPPSDLEVTDAAEARDAALTFLGEKEPENAPGAGITWQEEDVTPRDKYGHPVPGAVHREFTSDEWTIKVSYAVLPPERTVYRVTINSIKLGWHWKGSIKADGTVTEISAFRQMSEEESQKLAEKFLRNSPTFTYDGIEDTLTLVDTLRARCPYCWTFIFEFDSRHSGYGDRTGQARAEVITHHRAVIAVELLEITSAVMDDRWDMLRREMIDEQGKPIGILSVAELLENPVYDTEIKIHGEVSLLGELFCPCFELTSGGQKVQVWYDMMVENDGTERPAVSVEGINNGDRVIVTGELKGEGGTHYSKGDFWAIVITLTPPPPPEEPVGVSIDVSCDDFMKIHHISKEAEVPANSSLTVTLCSNPTTGFEWESPQITDETVLTLIDHKFVPPETKDGKPPPGTPGKEIWTFKALKKGTSTISIDYSRPWEGGEKAEWTFNLTAIVK